MAAALATEYHTEWHLDEVARWGTTARIYPSGHVVEIAVFGEGQFIADTFATPAAHEAGAWLPAAPLAGRVFETAEAAAAAADIMTD